jgi:cation diffusion facilitator family transporter
MSGKDGGSGHIIQSLIVNSLIATAKGVAAFFTGSGAMLAEAIHSGADCGNQLLLLRGVKEGRRPADATHPLGYGRNVYFWSFMVALLLFTGGGMFSIYEGVHKLQHPEKVENVMLAVVILGFSLLLESWATYGNVKELNKRRGAKPFFRFLKDTKDSDLVVVFGENSAAVLGLAIALAAILTAHFTGEPRADAVGSILVGVVLVGVAVFLAVEVKSLLVGECADPEIAAAVHKLAVEDKRVLSVRGCVTMQQGPGEVVVAIKIQCEPHLTAHDISALINEFEGRLRSARPECRYVFVEPDLSPLPAAPAIQAAAS